MKFEEKKISGKTVFDGKILKVEVDEVRLPDGKTSVRECVRHHGGSAVLCVIHGRVLLVRQYRYLYGKEIYEIPAGKLEAGEDPLETAKRELLEETGYRANTIVPYITMYPTPGYTDEVIHIYKASNCYLDGQMLDEGEFLDVRLVKLEDALKMIENGEITDAKTVASIYKYMYENK